MSQRKFLITGATGNTGRSATEILIKQGFAVRALVHREDERSARLSAVGAEIPPVESTRGRFRHSWAIARLRTPLFTQR
jgi:uncharacterized protein YbjT (DUF2867 family)